MALRSALSLLVLLMAGTANAGEGIDGRFGRTEIRYIAAKPAVFQNGRKALDIDDADEAAILRLMPEATRDFIVLQARKPAKKCIASYRLLTIESREPMQASPAFGDCAEIAGINIAGQYPVMQLRQASGKIEQRAWKDGKIFELPPITEPCFAKHQQAIEKSSRQPQAAAFVAAGEGRLQFLSAPDERREIAGTFVVPGDRLEASRVHGRYTLVFYQHPKAARVAAGWVDSARLKPAN